MGNLRANLFAVSALVFAAALPSSAGYAQSPTCSGQVITSTFGQGCASRSGAPALTDHDYGFVHIEFSPPPTIEDVVRERDLNGTWLQGLLQRTTGARTTSALVLLEIRAVGGDNLKGADPERGVPLAIVPLAAYEYDGRSKLRFSEQQEFANRDLQANLLLERGLRVSAHIRVVFSNQNVGSLINSLRPIVNATAAFGGHGFVVNAFASQPLMNDLQSIEATLRSPGNTEASTENRVDLNFEGGNDRLEYSFQLTPRGARDGRPRPKGMLLLTLGRRPSLFTADVLPGQSGARLPNYHVATVQDSERIWIDGRVGPGESPDSFVRRSELLRASVTTFQGGNTPEAEFDRVCETLRDNLSRVGLSRHDRAAVFWAAFARGSSSERAEIQARPCIARERPSWTNYGFVLPNTAPARPPLPTPAMRDAWIRIAAAALRDETSSRAEGLMDLFNPQVMVTIAPNTLYAADDPVPPSNTVMPRATLVRDMKVLRVGCRFAVAADAPRFSVLARRTDNNQLLTLVIDYAGRVGGATNVEVVGLQVRETSDADWAALAETNDVRPACRASNRQYAPLAPPAPPAPAPAVLPAPPPVTPPQP